MTSTECPPPLRLAELLNGKLDAASEHSITRHLDQCDRCRQWLERLAGDPRFLDDARQNLGGASMETVPLPPAELVAKWSQLKPTPHITTFLPPASVPNHTPGAQPSRSLGEFPRAGHCLGPYELRKEVGRGGMGVVFLAHDQSLHRPVAIKLLGPHWVSDPVARTRFLSEARAAAAVNHRNVVTIHAVVESDEWPHIVMEYVPGESLQQIIDTHGTLPLASVISIGIRVATGLAAAHARDLIHRDVKPGNVLVVPSSGIVKLTDFGLARAASDARITKDGLVVGTPAFMAPEQISGDTLDHRADLYSLGGVLHAMCTGRPPVEAEHTIALIRQVLDRPRPSIGQLRPELPDWLAQLIDQLLERDPDRRPQTALEVVDLLRRQRDETSTPRGRTIVASVASTISTPAPRVNPLDEEIGPSDPTRVVRPDSDRLIAALASPPPGPGKPRPAKNSPDLKTVSASLDESAREPGGRSKSSLPAGAASAPAREASVEPAGASAPEPPPLPVHGVEATVGPVIQARREPLVRRRTSRSWQRRPLALFGLVAVLVAAVGAVLWFAWQRGRLVGATSKSAVDAAPRGVPSRGGPPTKLASADESRPESKSATSDLASASSKRQVRKPPRATEPHIELLGAEGDGARFATLSDAIDAAPSGATLVLHGSSFFSGPLRIAHKPLVIRAASEDESPLIQFVPAAAEGGFLFESDSKLTLEGLTLSISDQGPRPGRRPGESPPGPNGPPNPPRFGPPGPGGRPNDFSFPPPAMGLVAVHNADCVLRRCRLGALRAAQIVQLHSPPSLDISNCQFHSGESPAIVVRGVDIDAATESKLRIEHSTISGQVGLLLDVRPETRLKLRLHGDVFLADEALRIEWPHSVEQSPVNPTLRVDAEDSSFDGAHLLAFWTHAKDETPLRRLQTARRFPQFLAWSGVHNAYNSDLALFVSAPPFRKGLPHPEPIVKDLDAWRVFWNAEEAQSKLGPLRYGPRQLKRVAALQAATQPATDETNRRLRALGILDEKQLTVSGW